MPPDFNAARKSIAAFGAMIGQPLADWQAQALQLETRTTCILAPRQTGKSRSIAILALWWAFKHPGARILIVSSGEEASRRLLALIRRIAMQSPLLAGSVLDEQAALLTVSNGASIRSATASERSIRGETADLLLIDEAALVSDDVGLGAAFPTTAARPEAKVVLASSPWAEGGFFYNHVQAGDSEHVRVHRWSLADATWIAPGVIEAARASMSEARFAAEYEARWATSLDAMFSRAVLERCHAAEVELPALAELRGPARLLGGQDWGVTTDKSANCWIARVPVGVLNPDFGRPVFVVSTRAWPSGEPLSNVVDEIVASPAHWAIFSSEQVGVGAGPTQSLFKRLTARPEQEGGGRTGRNVMWEERPWEPNYLSQGPPVRKRDEFSTHKNAVATSAQIKALVFERLRWLFDRRQIVTSDIELLRELASLRVELRPGGSEKIEAGAGHDDRADALMLAAAPIRNRHGGLRCLLAEAADSARPDTTLPEDFGGEVVETGGGLRVWRRPPLQSCSGPNLTLPDAARRPNEPRRIGRFTITGGLR